MIRPHRLAIAALVAFALVGSACDGDTPPSSSVSAQIEKSGRPDGWETLEADGISVLMPGDVQSVVQEPAPGTTAAIYSAEGSDYGVRMAIINYEDPAAADVGSVAASAVEGDGGISVEFEEVTLSGRPAVEGTYIFTGPNGVQGLGVVVAVSATPETVVQLRVAGSVENPALMSMFEVARESLAWPEVQS